MQLIKEAKGQMTLYVERPKKKKKKKAAAESSPSSGRKVSNIQLRGNYAEKSLRKYRPGEEPARQKSTTSK